MGDRGFDLFTLFVYFTQSLKSGGAFLAEMVDQKGALSVWSKQNRGVAFLPHYNLLSEKKGRYCFD